MEHKVGLIAKDSSPVTMIAFLYDICYFWWKLFIKMWSFIGKKNDSALTAVNGMTFPNDQHILNNLNIWIGDTGASVHSTHSADGARRVQQVGTAD